MIIHAWDTLFNIIIVAKRGSSRKGFGKIVLLKWLSKGPETIPFRWQSRLVQISS
jgi:hypothetical protein